ncbi:MAG TPA: DNA ligase D [Bryobacteraceae bacterium]|nr:DNA ligase D [Bryobacteraceae bacterium]
MPNLREYARKRSFDVTPEPPPEVKPSAPAKRHFFCVQRHDATRLHYDFRLEMDGVLKSWAVPKGPSLEPLSKHLAMMVEDHPFDYGNFEGNIPKGEYGGGSVMLWDRGEYELIGDDPGEAQIKRGDLKFRLFGEKIKGEFALVHMRGRGKGNEWLLIKKKDAEAVPGWNVEDHAVSVLTGRSQQEIADNLPAHKKPKKKAAVKKNKVAAAFDAGHIPGAVARAMPAEIEPMLATLAEHAPAGDGWVHEIKWDGVRAVCFVDDGRVHMFSRRGNRCEQQYPELMVLPHFVRAKQAILDGEIAVLDEQGRSRFNLIQPRIAQSDPNSVAHLARSTPATLFLFDVLYADGYDLRGAQLSERRRALEALIEPSERIRLSEQFSGAGPDILEAARQNGLEGIVSKRLDSPYEGRRSTCWVKTKATQRQEFVICGFTHGDRQYFSSLVLGLYENGKLVHAGQVGTGFNDRNIADLYHRLEPLITDKPPIKARARMLRDVTWVKPELVCEVKFLEFTPDGQLRAPVFIGLRNDKPAEESVREGVPQQQKFNNLNKLFYPKEGITKGDVINYYDAVAHLIVPHLKERPLSLKRYPNGIDEEFFFQKNAEKFPEWVQTVRIHSDSRGGSINYVICNDRATLLYLANLGCIDQNPWMSRLGSLDKPDYALIDLDPVECPYDMIVEAAQLVEAKLKICGLAGYPKTTGGDGMHIYIPLHPIYSYDQVRTFAEVLSHLVINENPDLFTTPRAVEKRRKGRVYFDYMQIAESKTIASAYCLRAYPGAPVSTPLRWSEVKKGLNPTEFNIHNAVERFERVGDLFEPVLKKPQRLEDALAKLSAFLGGLK